MTSEEITNLASFQALVRKRSRMAWWLSLVTLIVLFGNFYLMSWGADIGSRTMLKCGTVTIALAYSVFVVIFGACVAGFYVHWANHNLDRLISKSVEDIQAGDSRE